MSLKINFCLSKILLTTQEPAKVSPTGKQLLLIAIFWVSAAGSHLAVLRPNMASSIARVERVWFPKGFLFSCACLPETAFENLASQAGV